MILLRLIEDAGEKRERKSKCQSFAAIIRHKWNCNATRRMNQNWKEEIDVALAQMWKIDFNAFQMETVSKAGKKVWEWEKNRFSISLNLVFVPGNRKHDHLKSAKRNDSKITFLSVIDWIECLWYSVWCSFHTFNPQNLNGKKTHFCVNECEFNWRKTKLLVFLFSFIRLLSFAKQHRWKYLMVFFFFSLH